jgi:glycosyltransferase involved in cell wall biosynthesis
VQKLSIVYIVSSLGRSGPTNQLFQMISYLDRKQFEPTIITLSPEPKNSRVEEFSDLSVNLIFLEMRHLASLFFGTTLLNEALKSLAPDVIHSQGLRGDWLNSRLSEYSGRIATQRNNPFTDYPMLYGFLRGPAMALLHSHAFRNLPYVVACSNSLLKPEKNGHPSRVVISNGVTIDKHRVLPSKSDKQRLRRRLQLPQSGPLFLWAGPVIKRKQPMLAANAFREFTGPDAPCLIVLGDGPLLEECRRKTESFARVRFLGHTNHVSDYLQAADGFISSSLSEGMPNSVLEALTWGLPVFLSDIPAHRELLMLAPGVGDFFGKTDYKMLKRLVGSFESKPRTLYDPANLMGSVFDAESMSRSYQALYRKLINSSPPDYSR